MENVSPITAATFTKNKHVRSEEELLVDIDGGGKDAELRDTARDRILMLMST